MTQREALVVSAWTGYLLVPFQDLHVYIEELMGRPVQTMEMRSSNKEFNAELHERVRPEFEAILKEIR